MILPPGVGVGDREPALRLGTCMELLSHSEDGRVPGPRVRTWLPSDQACQPPALKCYDNVRDAKSLSSCDYASENTQMSIYPEALDLPAPVITASSPTASLPLKIPRDCWTVRQHSLPYPLGAAPSGTDGAESWEVCPSRLGSAVNYSDRVSPFFSCDNENF